MYCVFCNKFILENEPKEQFDEVLFKNDNFLCVPSLGQIVEGYLLIIPKQHTASMLNLSYIDFAQLIHFTRHVLSILKNIWGSYIVFEHGGCVEEVGSSSCIEHAHWHIVPLSSASSILALQYPQIKIFKELQKKKRPYLLYSDLDLNFYISYHHNNEKQFFRRLIASENGEKSKWNWHEFKFESNIIRTINKIKISTSQTPNE